MRVEEIYKKFGALVMHRAMVIVRNETDAEEILHEVFQILIETKKSFSNHRALVGWLYKVTTTRSLNLLRDRQKQDSLLRTRNKTTLKITIAKVEHKLIVEEIIQAIPSKIASAGVLYYMGGLNQAEIGEILGVSRRTVSNLLAKFVSEAKRLLSVR